MKINSKLTILFLGVLMLAVKLACSAVLSGSNENSSPSLPVPDTGETSGSSLITVTEDDFNLTLEPSRASAGELTFVVKNEGHLPHDFRIRGNGVDHRTPIIDPQGSETFTLELEPGTYNYECTVEGHDMLGMKGSFIVEESVSN